MKYLAATLSVLCLSVATPGLALAQTPAPPSGHWEGAIEIPGQPLKIEIDLRKSGETWEGTIAIPAQNLKGFPLSTIAVQGDAVSFGLSGIPGNPTFKGSIAKDAKTLAGEYSQGGGTMPFAVTRTGDAKVELPPKSTPITKEVQGSWEGALDVNGTILRLVFKLSTGTGGVGTGTLVSVDQGGVEIPVNAVIQTGSHLKLVVQAVAGAFEGDLKDGQLAGTWTQGPGTLPLVLKRTGPAQ
jgi:hypothetical protein